MRHQAVDSGSLVVKTATLDEAWLQRMLTRALQVRRCRAERLASRWSVVASGARQGGSDVLQYAFEEASTPTSLVPVAMPVPSGQKCDC